MVAHQAPLSMGFSRQEYWTGLPCPPPEDLPDPGIEPLSPVSLTLQVDSLPTEPSEKSTSTYYMLKHFSEYFFFNTDLSQKQLRQIILYPFSFYSLLRIKLWKLILLTSELLQRLHKSI